MLANRNTRAVATEPGANAVLPSAFDCVSLTERWENARPVDPDHPYLVDHGVKPYGLKQDGDDILAPIRRGKALVGLCEIGSDGVPRVTGEAGYFAIGEKPDSLLLLVTDCASGASVHEASGFPVAVALGERAEVARMLQSDRYRLVVCGEAGNEAWAHALARDVGGMVALPDFLGEGSGSFNDLHGHAGLSAVEGCIANMREPDAPVRLAAINGHFPGGLMAAIRAAQAANEDAPSNAGSGAVGRAGVVQPPTYSPIAQRCAEDDSRRPVKAKQKPRPGRSGRDFPGHYVVYPDAWFNTPEYRRLSHVARTVWQAIYRQYIGTNNGNLTFTKGQARDWRVGERQRTKALRDLREAGWIIRTRRGGLHAGPDLYAVSVKQIDRVFDKTTGMLRIDVKPGTDYLHIWEGKYVEKRAAMLDREPDWRRRDGLSKRLAAKLTHSG